MEADAHGWVADAPAEAVRKFGPVCYYDAPWDLSHLDAHAFQADIGCKLTVVVHYSCHCFTHSTRRDPRPRHLIPAEEIYRDAREERVLDPQRYRLSRLLLRPMIRQLEARRIHVADPRRPNFLVCETMEGEDNAVDYVAFFEVTKDRTRRRRLLLRVQSAYVPDGGLTARQEAARRVNLRTLLKAVHENRPIRP